MADLTPRTSFGKCWSQRAFAATICVIGAMAVCLNGCRPPAPTLPKIDDGPATVSVARPIQREVTDFSDFTGRTEAQMSLEVRSRVTGYLVGLQFREGSEVKQGELLFEIDPRPYQAQLDQSTAVLSLREAQYKLAIAENRRVREANMKSAGTFTAAEVDTKQAAEDEALAAVNAAKASLESDRLNVEFTKVVTPIDGQVNRFNVTLGNLINQDQTVLTTVVSQDPIYVYFDMDEPTLLRVTRRLMQSNADLLKTQQFPVLMGLADEAGFPHKGFINFANNVVSASTGTISIRGEFQNPPGNSGRRLLRPGMFVRVRLPMGQPHPALLVAESALATDQGQKYLLVVDEQDTVRYRNVTTGPLQDDGLRVIEEGLQATDRVIVSGLQLARPGKTVKIEETTMEQVLTSGSRSGKNTTGNPSAGGKKLSESPAPSPDGKVPENAVVPAESPASSPATK